MRKFLLFLMCACVIPFMLQAQSNVSITGAASVKASKEIAKEEQNSVKEAVESADFLPYNPDAKVSAPPRVQIPSLSRGNTAYANNNYGTPAAYISFDVETPNNRTALTAAVLGTYGGDYFEGVFYTYNQTGDFLKVNSTTGAIIATMPGAWTEFMSDMAYDYTSGIMYGVKSLNLYTINLTTGVPTLSKTITGHGGTNTLCFAIDLDGNAYCIPGNTAANTSLYSIDLGTGACTLIGNTGRLANYAQCMAFDHNTGILYWPQCSATSDMNFLIVDKNTGATTVVANTGCEFTGLHVPYTHGTPCAAITNLQANVVDHDVTLTWTAAAGTPTGYQVYMNNALEATVTTTTHTFSTLANGVYSFSVKAIFGGDCIPVNVAVNDIQVPPFCAPATNLNAVVTDNDVALTWTAPAGSPTSYDIYANDVFKVNVTTTSHTLVGLADGVYVFSVKAIFTSACEPVAIDTPPTLVGDCFDQTIGTGTTSTYLIPINTYYRHSYSQQIFDAAEMGISAGTINSVSFQYVWTAGQDKANFSIYLGNTSKSTFSGTTDWVPFGELEQVLDPTTMHFDNTGANNWVTIEFDAPFIYTGGNVVLAVLNNDGDYYTGSNPTFSTHAAGANKTLHYRVDGTVHIDPATLSTGTAVIADRNNVQFFVCQGESAIPAAPTNFTAVPVGSTLEVALQWTNPTETISGTPLTSITKMVVERNGVVVGDNLSPAGVGAVMNWTDNTLTSAGTYEYKVYAVTTENGVKATVSGVVVGEFCNIVIDMQDDYGDGWNNARIDVRANGAVVGTATLTTGMSSGTTTILVPAAELTFTWVSGTYDDECTFQIYDAYEIELYAYNNVGTAPAAGVFFTYNNTCAAPVMNTISGTVTALAGGAPIVGATINYAGPINPNTVTDAGGAYTLDVIQGRTYNITVAAAGYNTITETGYVPNGNATKNYTMTAPGISVAPTSLDETTNYMVDAHASVTITNTGNGPMNWSLSTDYLDKAPNTVAWAIKANDDEIGTFPLNQPSNFTVLSSGTPELLGGGDYVAGDWYAIAPNSGNIYKINPTTGAITSVAQHSVATALGFACHPDGTVYVKSSAAVYTVNITTGATALAFTPDRSTTCFAITNEGRFIALDMTNDVIVEIDPASGATTTLMSCPIDANYIQDMAIDRETNTIYWASTSSAGAFGLYVLDLDNNSMSSVGTPADEMVAFAIPTSGGWLSSDVSSGTIAAGATQVVNFTMDGWWAESGTFHADAIFKTNNPDVGTATVDVTFTIAPPACNAPSNLTATVSDYNDITLNWTAATGTGLEGYNIYHGDDMTPFATVALVTTYVDADIAPEGTYCYKVRARYSDGCISMAPDQACETVTVKMRNITGTVRDAQTHAAIVGANVRFSADYTAPTDALGEYDIMVPKGTYNVQISATGYTAKTVTGFVADVDKTLDVELEPFSVCDPVTGYSVVHNTTTDMADLSWTSPAKGGGSRDVIYSEGFEGTSGMALPTGWTKTAGTNWQTIANGESFEQVQDIFVAAEGTRSLGRSWYNSGNNWAFSAGFELVPGAEYTVSYWFSAPGYAAYGERDNFEVKVGTAQDAGSMTTTIQSNVNNDVHEWELYTHTFTATTGGTHYLGFHDLTPTQQGIWISIDAIEITGAGGGDVGELTGFDIYRNNIKIANVGTAVTQYSDDMSALPGGAYNYCVVAVYEGCEASPVCGIINIDGIKAYSTLSVYPNPSNGIVNIEGANVASVTVHNSIGQLVAKYENTNTINVSSYTPGIYLFNVITVEGKAERVKVVVTR